MSGRLYGRLTGDATLPEDVDGIKVLPPRSNAQMFGMRGAVPSRDGGSTKRDEKSSGIGIGMPGMSGAGPGEWKETRWVPRSDVADAEVVCEDEDVEKSMRGG